MEKQLRAKNPVVARKQHLERFGMGEGRTATSRVEPFPMFVGVLGMVNPIPLI